MLRFVRAIPSPIHVLLVFALAIGYVGCDSGGSSSSGDDGGDENTGPSVAQTFTVTVEPIDSSYPYANSNTSEVAYAIDGQVGETISLQTGNTYEFELGSGVDPDHPFYIGTSAEGAGGDEFRNNPAKKTTGTVTFSIPFDAPDSLYYVCGNHVYMGGKMSISGSSGDDGDDDPDDPNY